MHSSGSSIAAATLLLVAVVVSLGAETTGPEVSYNALLAREASVRRQIERTTGTEQSPEVVAPLREIVRDYEAFARKYPTSGYSDNALWQGAKLAADSFWQFGSADDQQTARRLFRAIGERFRSSSLVAKVPDELTRLDRARPTSPASSPATRTQPAASRTTTSGGPSTLTAIRREVLADAVRITLALEHETPFLSQQLENPARLSIDLQNTRVLYALKDAKLSFDDDVVKQIRVGSHQGDRTRVVIDLEDSKRVGIYPVYDPYRLIIDFERPAPASAPPTRTPIVRTAGPSAPPESTRSKPLDQPTAAAERAVATRAAASPSSPALGPAPSVPSANGTGGFSLSRQLGLGAARIVIDAGHGGHDPGARGAGLTEAELVLDVALKLEKLLLKSPGVEVIMTRRTSEFIPLEERTAIANRAGADLFLSIHANASTNTGARGIETYYLNFAPNEDAEAIAARENAGSTQTMRNLPEIVRTIALNNKIDESRDFAGFVQKALYAGLRKPNKQAKNLGVKQAPFQVLIGATMPSILAEISFITNKQEGALLKTDKYRTQIAEALFNGVMAYQQALKRGTAVAAAR